MVNWLQKVIAAGSKIKERIRDRATREEIKNSKWMSPCCGNTPILKSSIFNDEQLNTCSNCDKHFPFPPRQRFDHFYGKNKWELIDTPRIPDDPLRWPGDVYKKKLASARKATNQRCSVLVAIGERDGMKITSFAINSAFIGGAISVESAEAILKACDVAIENQTPLIAWSEGGGQIMFESGLSLQGMARTVLGVNEVKKNNLPNSEGYTLENKISLSELEIFKNAINKQWLERIKRDYPETALEIKNKKISIENYHKISDNLKHEEIWSKSERILPK